MRIAKKILFIILFILIIVFCAGYIFLGLKGKALIIKQLESITHKKVSIADFAVMPPINIEAGKLNIEGLGKIDYIFLSPSILGFLSGNIAFNEIRIVRPELTYEKAAAKTAEPVNQAAVVSAPAPVPVSAPTPGPVLISKEKRHWYFILKRLSIENGTLNIIDRAVGKEGIKIAIKEINLYLNNLYLFPRSMITRFELKGKIPWEKNHEEGKILAEGWLNLYKKDIQASLKIEDIDGVYLYPYYSTWVDLDKARIEKAKLSFTSDIQGNNNNVTADCHLELTDIVRRPRPLDEPEEKAEKIASAIFDIFRAMNKGKVGLDFKIKTKMDSPEFGFDNIRMAFEDKLAEGKKMSSFGREVLALPGKFIKGTIKEATDITTAVVSGTISAGKQIGQAVGDSFKKEKKDSE